MPIRIGCHRSCRCPDAAAYSSSLTFSIHSTVLPSFCSTMAMCVMAVVFVAPCQCFSPGGHQTTSPGRIRSTGPPQLCTRPQPRSEEHTSELQSHHDLVCRLLL